MSIFNSLWYKNLSRRRGRTLILIMLSMFLSFAITAGSLAISGLKDGLSSLEARLGADIMVVPKEALENSDFSNMILQGNPGYFYMDRAVIDVIEKIEGVKEVSEQYFLASLSASCCSSDLQLIGFNPETDFAIRPWLDETYKGELGEFEILVGNDLNVSIGDTLTFFNNVCTIQGKLKKTGTYLDAAVYMGVDTIKKLLASADELNAAVLGGRTPDELTSSVLVNIEKGYNIKKIVNEINLNTRRVEAVQTKDLISGVSNQLASAAEAIGMLIAAIWILSVIILMLAFTVISNERKKEFAVLRVIGASRKTVALTILKEGFAVNLIGSLIGALAAIPGVSFFGGMALTGFDMPFLFPDTKEIVLIFAATVTVSVFAGCLASALSELRTAGIDTALILREGN